MDNNEAGRKLSGAELKRKQEFDLLTDKLCAEGYEQKILGIRESELSIALFLVTIPLMLPFLLVYFLVWRTFDIGYIDLLIAFLLFTVLIVVHEILHGITWSFFAKSKWRSISFGFILKSFTPYCNCKEPLKRSQLTLGILMPTIILGLGLAVVSIIFGSTMLLILSFLNILGGGGDLLIILKLIKHKPKSSDVLYIDHPYELGIAVFEK